jgi:hypothetical protein
VRYSHLAKRNTKAPFSFGFHRARIRLMVVTTALKETLFRSTNKLTTYGLFTNRRDRSLIERLLREGPQNSTGNSCPRQSAHLPGPTSIQHSSSWSSGPELRTNAKVGEPWKDATSERTIAKTVSTTGHPPGRFATRTENGREVRRLIGESATGQGEGNIAARRRKQGESAGSCQGATVSAPVRCRSTARTRTGADAGAACPPPSRACTSPESPCSVAPTARETSEVTAGDRLPAGEGREPAEPPDPRWHPLLNPSCRVELTGIPLTPARLMLS